MCLLLLRSRLSQCAKGMSWASELGPGSLAAGSEKEIG